MSNLLAAITIVTVLSIVGCTRAPKENSGEITLGLPPTDIKGLCHFL